MILLIQITTGKAVLTLLGTVLLIAIAFMFGLLARGGSTNIEEEAKDIPGYDDDYTFSERPYNKYI
jgi:hypothetical protein